MARKGLGRGLEALLADNIDPQPLEASSPADEKGVRTIPLGDITPDPNQPRKAFDGDAIDELAASIKTQGLLQPILVRPAEDANKYIIIAGERRWRASAKAGLHDIPALIRKTDAATTADLALIENLQRTDLNPMEEAEAYARIRDVFKKKPADIAEALGKSRSHIANMLRLTGLPDEVKEFVKAGELSMGHARALLGAKEPVELAKLAIAKGLSVRDVERKVAGHDEKPAATKKETSPAKPSSGGSKDADTRSLEADLEAVLGLSVAIEHTKKGGTVTLAYDTLDQLDDICRRLMGTTI